MPRFITQQLRTMQLKVKWGKERYEVEVDPTKPVADLKAELFKRTGA